LVLAALVRALLLRLSIGLEIRRRRIHRAAWRNNLGRVGSGGTSSGFSGRTSRGVISTISSVRDADSDLLLNRLPMIGRLLRIGIAERFSCEMLDRSPAIAND
jgi:hypothetical protein